MRDYICFNTEYIIYICFSFEMTEEDLYKIPFFKLLNLQAITNLDSDPSEVNIIFNNNLPNLFLVLVVSRYYFFRYSLLI